MAKETCSKCGGPREPDSPTYSYCKSCTKEKARERYAIQRQAAGFAVTPRTNETAQEVRRRRLLQGDGLPGRCEACLEHEHIALTLIRITNNPTTTNTINNTNPPTPTEDELYGGGEVKTLWCRNCRGLAYILDDANLRRAAALAKQLTRLHLTLSQVLPDVQDVVMGTVPTPWSPNTPNNTSTAEQKAPK